MPQFIEKNSLFPKILIGSSALFFFLYSEAPFADQVHIQAPPTFEMVPGTTPTPAPVKNATPQGSTLVTPINPAQSPQMTWGIKAQTTIGFDPTSAPPPTSTQDVPISNLKCPQGFMTSRIKTGPPPSVIAEYDNYCSCDDVCVLGICAPNLVCEAAKAACNYMPTWLPAYLACMVKIPGVSCRQSSTPKSFTWGPQGTGKGTIVQEIECVQWGWMPAS